MVGNPCHATHLIYSFDIKLVVDYGSGLGEEEEEQEELEPRSTS